MPERDARVTPPLRVAGLAAGYGGRSVLAGVDMQVDAGEIRCIIGGSGSGKTTLMRHIIGLIPPAQGIVEVLGHNLYAADLQQRAGILGRIGVVFQNGALLGNLNVLDNVALPLRQNTSLPDRLCQMVARIKLRQLGMEDAALRSTQALSGGMAKRVALARALALDPPLLICDEPAAGLDPVTAAGLDQLLLDQRQRFGTSIVVVTHERDSIRTIADTLTVVGEGGVLADGPIQQVEQSSHPGVLALLRREAPASAARGGSLLERVCPDGGQRPR